MNWKPDYSTWRHGGWYVGGVHYPSGAIGCVSRNYPDKKWRIVCHEGAGTFSTRAEAALAERCLALEKHLDIIAKRTDEAGIVHDGTDTAQTFRSLRDFAIAATRGSRIAQ